MPSSSSALGRLVGALTRLELAVAAAVAAVLTVLVVIEPDILEAPVENANTMVFTFGGTAAAVVALALMLWFRVPAPVRIVVLLVPFAAVNWWLLSPFFIDDVVDEEFVTSIADELAATEDRVADEPVDVDSTQPEATQGAAATETTEAPAPPAGPVLLGAGSFRGLAGHSGTGDAGLFQNPDGTYVLRFENFDIQNGPDLEVYVVPGADQTDLASGSIHLGALKGNVGDQSYELPPDTTLAPGPYTALVWCEAFSVEFVGATLQLP